MALIILAGIAGLALGALAGCFATMLIAGGKRVEPDLPGDEL